MEMYIAWWWMCTLSFYIFCCEFLALLIASFAHLRFLKFDTPLLCMTRLQYMWKALSLCKVNMSGDSTHLYLTPLLMCLINAYPLSYLLGSWSQYKFVLWWISLPSKLLSLIFPCCQILLCNQWSMYIHVFFTSEFFLF